MMLPTHALAGMALALPVALAVPELAGVVLLAGFLGGVLPDLDMYAGHRKRLHYPVYYPLAAVGALPVAVLAPSAATVGVTVALAAAAAHSVADVFGGGLELRPWEGTADRAVYDHYRDAWVEPRRWIRYDGSPGDLLLSVALAVPLLAAVDGPPQWLVVAAVIVGVVYAAVRRLLPAVAAALVARVLEPFAPAAVADRVPARYRDGGSTATDGR